MKTSQRKPTGSKQVLHGLGELAAYVPYLFGFHPTDSLVVLGSGSGGVGPVARADVVDEPGAQRAVSDRVRLQMTRAAPDWHEMLLFGDTVVGRDLLRGIGAQLRQVVGPVHHLVVVRAGERGRAARWQVAECRCGRRCRAQWNDVPSPDRVPMIAEHVLAGHAPARDRAALEASVQTRPLLAQSVLTAGRRPPDAEAYARSLLRVLDLSESAVPVERLPVPVLCDVLHGLAEADVRDHLLEWLVPEATGAWATRPDLSVALRRAGGRPRPHGGDPACAHRLQERLRILVTCAPVPLLPAPATVLGYWCWAHGGGALAAIALERALQADPGYRLAQLLVQVVEHGLRPELLRAGGSGAAG